MQFFSKKKLSRKLVPAKISTIKVAFIIYYINIQGEKIIKSSKTALYKSLPKNKETKVVYTGIKLASNFSIKDKTKFNHKHDLVYYVKCPECHEYYLQETGRRLHEQIYNHSGMDSNSYMFKYSLENNHEHISSEDFCIL